MNKIELVYAMDPHCGWCFGFGSVIMDLYEKYRDQPSVDFDIRPGGLFYPAIEVPKGFANEKKPMAKRIAELSGVKFSRKYFSKVLHKGNLLDSEPPARAILCVKDMQKEIHVPFSEKLFEMEFINGKNNSSYEVILESVKEFNIKEDIFEAKFHSEEMKYRVQDEIHETRSLVTGFPVLFAKHNDRLTKLASGFAPMERLVRKIETLTD